MNKLLLFIAVAFFGCTQNTDHLSTKEFTDNVFVLEQKTNSYGDNYWQPSLNRGIRQVDKYFEFFTENEPALRYLKWNLLVERLPDSIKYSSNNIAKIQSDFQSFIKGDEEIQHAIELLIYPENFRGVMRIGVDSLVNLSAKLFYATAVGDGKIGWKLCSGKSKFPEIYGISESYESITLQALCFQAVFEEEFYTGHSSVYNFFKQKIPEVSSEMNEIEYDNYANQANLIMWKKMSQSKELAELMVRFTAREKTKLYFKILHK